jgi:hypothetical protein
MYAKEEEEEEEDEEEEEEEEEQYEKRPYINLLITYLARAENKLLP